MISEKKSVKFKRVPQTQLDRDRSRAANWRNDHIDVNMKDNRDDENNTMDIAIPLIKSSATVSSPTLAASASVPGCVTRSKTNLKHPASHFTRPQWLK